MATVAQARASRIAKARRRQNAVDRRGDPEDRQRAVARPLREVFTAEAIKRNPGLGAIVALDTEIRRALAQRG